MSNQRNEERAAHGHAPGASEGVREYRRSAAGNAGEHRTDPRSLMDWDHEYVWHPFTQMQEWLADDPVIIESGDGNYLVDVHGRRYLDGVSSLWCNVHGHRKREIDDAIRLQLGRIAHSTTLGLGNVPSTELAKRLVEIAPPGLVRVFYSDAGATATEIALKMAFQYQQLRGETKRTLFASLSESYHGDTVGAVSLGYSDGFHRHYKPLLFPCIRIDPPHVFRFYERMDPEAALAAAIDQARTTLRKHADELAAVFVEPLMQGAAGMWPHPPEYLRELRALTKELGILLVCDEVATGFGKTGTMFACEQAGVTPDLFCIAKGISGGYLPLAATLATREVFEAFLGRYEERKAFFHGHTYTGNPLACAAALASLDLFGSEKVLERLAPRIRQLGELLAREVAPLPHVVDVRRTGVMTGIELMRDPEKRESYDPAARTAHRVILAARKRGVIIRPLGDNVFLMPPLSITADEVEHLVHATAESIREVTGA